VHGRDLVVLAPGDGYMLTWKMGGQLRILTSPKVARLGSVPLDRWVQVAPGGEALAVRSVLGELSVYAADGTTLLQRAATAFRFSPDGGRLAIATGKGLSIFSLQDRTEKALAMLPGAEEMRWTDAGLVVRARGALFLIPDNGVPSRLAAIGAKAPFAAAGNRLVYARPSVGLVSVTLPSGASENTPLPSAVTDLELAPDGGRLLVATGTQVLLQTGAGLLAELARTPDVRSLAFSPDGTQYLWAGPGGGRASQGSSLPSGSLTAAYAPDGSVMVTTRDGVFRREAATGKMNIAGGISSADGVNFAGLAVGKDGVVALSIRKPGWMKKTESPPETLPVLK